MKDHSAGKILIILFGLTLLALLVHGYHPGAEDDGVSEPAGGRMDWLLIQK